jgi:hypothetical protein
MSDAPADLRRVRVYLVDVAGLATSAVGIVGDASHTWGYHLGRDRIYRIPPGRGDRDPSVQHKRDRAGLDDNASALDIGRHAKLTGLGRYLLRTVLDDSHPAASDICELIAETGAGTHLWAWSRTRGLSGTPYADTPYHHLHVSWRRDSRDRDKVDIFARYYEPEATMRSIYSTGERLRTFAPGTPYYRDPEPDAAQLGTLEDPHVVYEIVGELRDAAGEPEWWMLDGGGAGQPMRYVRAG